jgi:two-component SAPR family response regulator
MRCLLLVDGNPALCFLHTFHLKNLGCKVVVQNNFTNTLEYLEENTDFDAMFLSIKFPYEQEFDFFHKVRERFPQLPIVIICESRREFLPSPFIEQIDTAEFMLAPVSKADFETMLIKLKLL